MNHTSYFQICIVHNYITSSCTSRLEMQLTQNNEWHQFIFEERQKISKKQQNKALRMRPLNKLLLSNLPVYKVRGE